MPNNPRLLESLGDVRFNIKLLFPEKPGLIWANYDRDNLNRGLSDEEYSLLFKAQKKIDNEINLEIQKEYYKQCYKCAKEYISCYEEVYGVPAETENKEE